MTKLGTIRMQHGTRNERLVTWPATSCVVFVIEFYNGSRINGAMKAINNSEFTTARRSCCLSATRDYQHATECLWMWHDKMNELTVDDKVVGLAIRRLGIDSSRTWQDTHSYICAQAKQALYPDGVDKLVPALVQCLKSTEQHLPVNCHIVKRHRNASVGHNCALLLSYEINFQLFEFSFSWFRDQWIRHVNWTCCMTASS